MVASQRMKSGLSLNPALRQSASVTSSTVMGSIRPIDSTPTLVLSVPPGLTVAVTPAPGGEQLAVDDVPSWLFSSTSGDRGHEPLGKVDVPSEGNYLVAASAEGEPAPAPPKLATV